MFHVASSTVSTLTTVDFCLIFFQRGIHFSIISPRKIPALYSLFEMVGAIRLVCRKLTFVYALKFSV
jgi:hypothetical protein